MKHWLHQKGKKVEDQEKQIKSASLQNAFVEPYLITNMPPQMGVR